MQVQQNCEEFPEATTKFVRVLLITVNYAQAYMYMYMR